MVMKMIEADPQCLKRVGTAIDLQGNPFTGTPLQAALHTTDIELCGKIKCYFDRYFSEIKNGQREWHRQIRELYTQSLAHYQNTLLRTVLTKLETEQLQLLQLPTLDTAQTERYQKIDEKIKAITRSIIACKTALKNKNEAIQRIIEAHNQAQEAYAFDFEHYINAICAIDLNDPIQKKLLDDVMELINAKTPQDTAAAIAKTGVSPIQTDVARAKSFDQLTPVEKLNRFREEYCAYIKPEIIANSYHILAGFKSNERTCNTLPRAADPEYKKRIVIFSQLVGWTQRNASEPVRQDIRQGTIHLKEKTEPRLRPSCFNTWDDVDSITHNSLVDCSFFDFSVVDGIGYKFAATCLAALGAERPVEFAEKHCVESYFFRAYIVLAKNSKLSELIAQPTSARSSQPSEYARYAVMRQLNASAAKSAATGSRPGL